MSGVAAAVVVVVVMFVVVFFSSFWRVGMWNVLFLRSRRERHSL
jgi:hypothetical protein